MAHNNARPLYAAGIIERQDNSILIVRTADSDRAPSCWQFPCGLARDDESAEGAMRRIARDLLGLDVDIVVGQPPLVQIVEGREAEIRFFFCGVHDGEAHTDHFAELRWIHKAHLREYAFDGLSAPVADWLLEPRH